MTATATCRFCGAEFKASPAGTTVHCPAHRTRESRRTERATTAKATVAATGRTCTVVVGTPMIRCGRPAVFAFEASTGEIFAECAEHAHR